MSIVSLVFSWIRLIFKPLEDHHTDLDCSYSPELDSIFHDPQTNILFASFKYIGYDYQGDMEKMRENEKVREWWKMTDGWQESMVPGAKSSEAGEPGWWKPVEEVFYTA